MNDVKYSPIASRGISWLVGESLGHGNGFVMAPKRTMSKLPVEFWNHELMQSDFMRDKNALEEFVRSYGFPYHPLRNSFMHFTIDTGIAETEKRFESFIPVPKPSMINERGFFVPSDSSPALFYISETEAKSSLTFMQLFIKKAVYGECGFVDDCAMHVINQAACNPRPLSLSMDMVDVYSTTLQSRGLLTSAICNQILEAFDDAASWRTCQCEGCGRIFKRKRSARARYASGSESMYCCDACKERQVKRNQRKAAKNRIQH